MNRIAVLFALSSCLSNTTPRTKYIVSGAAIVLGTVTLATAGPSPSCNPSTSEGQFGLGGFCELSQNMRTGQIILGVTAVLAGIVGIVLTYQRDVPPTPEVEPVSTTVIAGADTIREPATTDPMLRQLTAQASMASRAGHCSAVRALGDRVARIDNVYRANGFVADPVIAACLK